MKNKLVCFVFMSLLNRGFAQNTTPHRFNSKQKVGAIEFDTARDNKEFHLCDEFNIMEYYQTNPKYGEGFKSIRMYFKNHLNTINELIDFETGIITVRFIINCKGKTDRFRVFVVDGNYKMLNINQQLEQLCINTVKNMGDWKPGNDSGEYFDSYFTLSLKIRDGKINGILP